MKYNMFNRLIKKWKELMSRPKTVKLEHGEVSLHGFPKEVSDSLVQHIKGFNKPTIVVPGGTPLDEIVHKPHQTTKVKTEDSNFTDTALGIRQVGNKYELVYVKYNADTKEAIVDKVHAEDFRRDVTTKFKMAASELKFV